jgi:hypothetical protein
MFDKCTNPRWDIAADQPFRHPVWIDTEIDGDDPQSGDSCHTRFSMGMDDFP